ncbi:MAG: hypothetical protein GXP46_01915 [Deferribacteres bacterium]|nr:hypothetical protein [Deferribacteres bacterium]
MAITGTERTRRPERGGVDIVVEFSGDVKTTKTFHFAAPNPSKAEIDARIQKAAARMQYRLNPLNELEVEGADVRLLLQGIVKYIRSKPDVTFQQLIVTINAKHPELNWKPEKLLQHIIRRAGKNMTFQEFKTICIGRKFYGVDDG